MENFGIDYEDSKQLFIYVSACLSLCVSVCECVGVDVWCVCKYVQRGEYVERVKVT